MTQFDDLCADYKNDAEWHGKIFDDFYQQVEQTPYLKAHRDWVEDHQFGMGDRPFHKLWEVIVDTMPSSFKMCEVGVYRGQVVSLVALIAKKMGKTASVIGVSPFEGTRDSENAYNPELDYYGDVREIFGKFSLDFSTFVPIKGYSQSPEVIAEAQKYGLYDILYIDGSHVYDDVVKDIENYTPMVRVGGILVMDDASCHLNMPEFTQDKGYNRCWPGVRSVSDAVRDFLDTREDFIHCFAVGHNRVYLRVE